MRRAITKFGHAEAVYRCPICSEALMLDQASLLCRNRHTFDISSKGVVSLLRSAPSGSDLYDQNFFEHRTAVFEAGIYQHVSEALIADVLELLATAAKARSRSAPDDHDSGSRATETMRIVDAGCGEGHYLRLVESALRDPDHRHDFEEHDSGQHSFGQHGDLTTDLMGFDLSKEAVTLAARGGGEIEWFVADLARIPLLDQTVDCIINIFSPANYAEFSRVLRPSGRLIKVIPGPSHVQELRQAIAKAGLRDEAEYSNSKVIEGISEHMNIIGTQSIRATTAVNEVLLRDFMAMTPVMFHIDPEQLDLQSIHEVTVDAEVIVATL